jgi:hypothetical protein
MKLSIKEPRPTCNCGNPVAVTRNYYDAKGRKTHVSWRKYCSPCHNQRTAEKYGLSNIKEITAQRNGFESVADYINSMHPYRKYRKDYCENVDGRLGHKCTATIVWSGQLQVDHIDGNHDNNDPENLQTLCANCHTLKTNIYRDWEDKKKEIFEVEIECQG